MSHTSSFHSLIGERANQRRNAKLSWELETQNWEKLRQIGERAIWAAFQYYGSLVNSPFGESSLICMRAEITQVYSLSQKRVICEKVLNRPFFASAIGSLERTRRRHNEEIIVKKKRHWTRLLRNISCKNCAAFYKANWRLYEHKLSKTVNKFAQMKPPSKNNPW